MAELETVTMAQVAAEMLWQLEHPEEFRRRRVRTGLRAFDEWVNPMKGELVLVGAENGSGKSVFINTLCNESSKLGKRTLLFTLEDSKTELRARMLGLAASLPPWEILRSDRTDDGPRITELQIARAKKAVEALVDRPFDICRNERNLDDILDTIEAVAEVDGLDVVAVDYLQALDGFNGAQDRRNQIRSMVQRLQKVAREHEVMLVVASQIVRPESRKLGGEPNRHWLKEASDIADAADKIIMLWRDQETGRGPTNIKCDKDKSGVATGWRGQLQLDGNCGAFVEIPHG